MGEWGGSKGRRKQDTCKNRSSGSESLQSLQGRRPASGRAVVHTLHMDVSLHMHGHTCAHTENALAEKYWSPLSDFIQMSAIHSCITFCTLKQRNALKIPPPRGRC